MQHTLSEYPQIDQKNIKDALSYAESLKGIPYRWCRIGEAERIKYDEDKFWAVGSEPVSHDKILARNLSIVCTGLINLIRRHIGLSVPGAKGSLVTSKYPGTTKTWFRYLNKRNRLREMDPKESYPKGTLLLAKFKNDTEDQGHVAILITEGHGGVLNESILHAIPEISYKDSKELIDHGKTLIEPLTHSHLGWFKDRGGYYTHICLPEDWILKD